MLRFGRFLFLAFTALLSAHICLSAQQLFADPANLRGERVRPHDGRELPIDQGSRGLEQMLRRLNTRASLMLIVAHPDDEDGGMLTYYSRGLGARVAVLTLTRGEGGQNAMTGDFEDALGLLRTQELLAADRYMGVDQMFGTEVDFGFSKTKEEAFSKWTHQRVLYDAVRAVRLYRPLVIAAVFIGGVTDGHGQHQVSGEIAQEIFKAAGDPKVFPELTAEGILPWQPLKMYARVPRGAITDKGLFDYATGQYAPAKFTDYITGEVTSTPPTADVLVHEGKTDPLLSVAAANKGDLPNPNLDSNTPLSYVQFARIGLGLQKSQIGPGVRNAPAGTFDIAYHLYGSCIEPSHSPDTCHPGRSAKRAAEGPAVLPGVAVPPATSRHGTPEESTFFDGVDTSLDGMVNSEPEASPAVRKQVQEICATIHTAVQSYDPAHPAALAPALAEALKQIQTVQSELFHDFRPPRMPVLSHELAVKSVQLEEALALALDVRVQANSSVSEVIAGAPTQIRAEITALRDPAPEHVFITTVPEGAIQRASPCPASYVSSYDGTSSEPFHPPLIRNCVVPEGNTARVTRPYFARDNIEQPVYKLLRPDLRNAAASPPAFVLVAEFQYRAARFEVDAVVEHDGQPVQIVPPVSLALSSHAQVLTDTTDHVDVTLFESGQLSSIASEDDGAPTGWTRLAFGRPANCIGCEPLSFAVPRKQRQAATIHPSVNLTDGSVIAEGFRQVGYGDLPRTNFFTHAIDRIVPVHLEVPVRRRIAYLPGTGDDVPSALKSVGLTPTLLTDTDLTAQTLAQFDTVILGVRTYNAHPDLHGTPTQALLDYARNGGNVVVQYQTAEFTGADAPYPLTLGNAEKVVDETAPVRLLDPRAASVATPNPLGPGDFSGWVEERGHGFLRSWDSRYTALTETADPGQEPQRGGWITVKLGHGHWTYCAFALYRQLPEAVPGAFRILMNQLALADEK